MATLLKRLLLSALAAVAFLPLTAQSLNVSGTVTDETGEPLPGVGVFVEGTTNGTVTNSDGHYRLRAKNTDVLSFSYISYETLREPVQGRTSIHVSLQPDRNLLEESVVIGYGTMRRSDLTGSVSSVSAKALEDYKTGSVLAALGGQVAGVNIISADGTPGAGFDIKIRGVGTVNGDSSPLYIVDGFEVDNIDYLANPDIKSVEILKDASASAIYGARAANGVVLVTTKEGRDGRPEITYNGSASYRILADRLEVLSPYEFVKLQLELNPSRYGTRYFQSGEDGWGVPWRFQSMDDYLAVGGIDWQQEAFRPTWSQNHDISLMGGNSTTRYTASFSHFDEAGIFRNSGYDKNSARIKFKQKVFNWLTMDLAINYTNSLKRGVGTGGSTLSNILQYRPTGGLTTSDYQLRYNAIDPILEELSMGNSNYFNPLLNAEKVDQTQRTDQWVANGSLNFALLKGLTFKTSGAYNTLFRRDDTFYREGSQQANRTAGPYGGSRNTRNLRWSLSNVLTYQNVFNKAHNVNVMLGHETSYEMNEWVYGEASDFPLDDLGVNNLGMGALPNAVNSGKTDKRRLSFFMRGFYNYKDRYMVTATLRADASTVFADNNKWGVFPSFAAAWTLSNEAFLQGVDWLSNLKLRAGWGTVGNDRISSYLSLNLLSASKYGLGGKQVTVLTPTQLPNPKLKWEGATTTNVGLDAGFFKDRINLTVDAFIKDSKDLLLAQSLSLVSGFSSQWQNVGKLRNKGIELSLNTINISSRHFSWTTDFNVSFIRNTLEALADDADYLLSRSGFNSNFASYDYIAKVGEPIGNMYGYVFDGVYQSSDFNMAPDGSLTLKPGVVDISEHAGQSVVPGFVKYKDLDGDGVITTEDRTIIGNGQPDWYGGFSNSFRLYGVDLSFMFQFSVGGDLYNAQRMWSTQSRLENQNFLAEVADRWTATNASNKVPSANGYVAYDVYSRFIEDGSYLRLKNITLGYTFPSRLTRKFFVSNLRLYATAQNLLCFTRYSGYDPEVNTLSSNLMPGFDWGAYPRSKVFTFGVEVKF